MIEKVHEGGPELEPAAIVLQQCSACHQEYRAERGARCPACGHPSFAATSEPNGPQRCAECPTFWFGKASDKCPKCGSALRQADPKPDPLPPMAPALKKVPETIAIIACGPTNADWHKGHFAYEKIFPGVDEVWSLNKGLRTTKCDLGFVMDDMVTEARRCPEYAADLRKLSIPIVTSTVDQQVKDLFPDNRLIEYPLDDVWKACGARVLANKKLTTPGDLRAYFYQNGLHQQMQDPIRRDELGRRAGFREPTDQEILPACLMHAGKSVARYIHNSVPYMLAFAFYIGVKGVQVFGADYTFDGQQVREKARANCEYWVGMLRAWGVDVRVPETSTLLNASDEPWLYGFNGRPPENFWRD